ncbi:MAG: type II secretion system protein [bacterium]
MTITLRRQSGFTLLETLAALAILTLVLGGTVLASRTMASQAFRAADRAQMTGLADEAISAAQLFADTRYEAPGAAPLSSVFGITSGGTVEGSFYTDTATGMVKWCERNTSCTNVTAPVVSTPVDYDNFGRSSVSDTYASVGGELVAVRRVDPSIDLHGGDATYKSKQESWTDCMPVDPRVTPLPAVPLGAVPHPMVLSALSPATGIPGSSLLGVTTSCLQASAANAKNWNFYIRSVIITQNPCKKANGTTPVNCLTTVAGLRTSSLSSVTTLQDLNSATYAVTVKVSNYLVPASTLTRTVFITDNTPSLKVR